MSSIFVLLVARALILGQYPFSLRFVLSSRVCSFNLCVLSSCSLCRVCVEISRANIYIYIFKLFEVTMFYVSCPSKF